MTLEANLELALAGERSAAEPDAFELRCSLGLGYAGLSPGSLPVFVFPLTKGPLPAGRRMGQVRTSFLSNVHFTFEKRQWAQSAAVVECLDRRLIRTFCCLGSDLSKRLTA